MKRILIVLAAMLCMFGNIAAAQPIKQKVAVYVTGNTETGYTKVIGSKLVSSITRSYDYAAVERTADFLSELTKEQDYMMSGAVSDNQIARLGQQFGVRYVLVADVSEVFETMFISARMIDVQTAQITNSAEASQVVSNMDSLSKIAEKIASEIVGTPTTVTEYSIKLLGNCTSIDSFFRFNVPAGYHIATKDEIIEIIKSYQMSGKRISLPIYTDIAKMSKTMTQYFSVKHYKHNKSDHAYNTTNTKRDYHQYHVTCTLIESADKSSILDLSYIDDSDYDNIHSIWHRPAWGDNDKRVSSGLIYMGTPKPSITPGYVYIVENK